MIEKYRAQLSELKRTARAVEQEREHVLELLYRELERVSRAPTKSGNYCQQACSLLTSALTQLQTARTLAKASWINSCSFSSHAQDAVGFAHDAVGATQFVKNGTCNDLSCNLSSLTRARDLALDTWIAADDAINDGCDSDMVDASYEASLAWANLSNAEHACSHC
ncbi:MAG: hypothetical protein MI919_04130 [Holophagales bacterium]|nr:hypothetical protein [Holophagales bacterium]